MRLLLREKSEQFARQRHWIGNLALPHYLDAPALCDQRGVILCVSRLRSIEFRCPVFLPALRHVTSPARMPMPEASVDKNNRTVLRQDNVWITGKVTAMKPESKTQLMKQRPYFDLWVGVFALDRPHQAAAVLWRQSVAHVPDSDRY